MRIVAGTVGFVLLLAVLWDTFETIILPRSVMREIRIARLFYRNLWFCWSVTARRLRNGRRREVFLSSFGPLSLPLLIGVWAICLIFSFALIHWSLGSALHDSEAPNRRHVAFGTDMYMSGTTFFTLGFGDVTPRTGLGRFLAVTEAGVGFGFLAIVIGYLPVLYQSFSRREVGISLLDARAGSPPSAGELLRRHSQAHSLGALEDELRDWERWAADLLESHLSYPVLAYYRSQHDRESWLAALTMILDAAAVLQLEFDGAPAWQRSVIWQAKMTYAVARHAAVDLALVLGMSPEPPEPDRLSDAGCTRLGEILKSAGMKFVDERAAAQRLQQLRADYEPYVNALATRLLLDLPPWFVEGSTPDDWQMSVWDSEHHF